MPTTTTSDAALLPLSELDALAAAYQQETDAAEAEAARERIAQAAADAVDDAHRHIRATFPATLARVLPAAAWAGYWEGDRSRDQDYDAVAVAHLGDDRWLHHALHIADEDHATHVLTLIYRCPCGDYTDTYLRDDYTLAQQLETMQHHQDNDTCRCTA